MTGVVARSGQLHEGPRSQRDFVRRQAPALDRAFADWGELTGRRYSAVQAHRCEDADEVLVAMGSHGRDGGHRGRSPAPPGPASR